MKTSAYRAAALFCSLIFIINARNSAAGEPGLQQQIRLVNFLDGEPDAIVATVCKHNLEGVLAKRITSRYEPDKRSGAWMKLKCGYRQEFVIGGYTRGSGGRSAFGALIVGYHDGAGRLRYASKVGTGSTTG